MRSQTAVGEAEETAREGAALQLAALRRILLALVGLGALGLLAELLLLEHTEGWRMLVPVVLLGALLALAGALAARPTRGAVLALRAAAVLSVAAGLLGTWFHLSGNLEFEREMDAALAGAALLREAMHGATPVLAPGALAQLGLLALAVTFRHPALGGAPTPHPERR